MGGQDVISDESLNKLFGILGDISDKSKYRNMFTFCKIYKS